MMNDDYNPVFQWSILKSKTDNIVDVDPKLFIKGDGIYHVDSLNQHEHSLIKNIIEFSNNTSLSIDNIKEIIVSEYNRKKYFDQAVIRIIFDNQYVLQVIVENEVKGIYMISYKV